MTFKIGDHVVYPSQGVALIRDVVDRTVGGMPNTFFVLELASSQSTVMIPAGNLDQVGLRPLSTPSEVSRVLADLQEEGEAELDWKKRYKENSEGLMSGSLEAAGRILKGLHILSTRKSLGVRDRKMMEQARTFVASEVAVVRNISEEEALSEIDSLLGISEDGDEEA